MSAHQDDYRITTMCRVLEVSRNGYYDWLGRPPAERTIDDALLTNRIKDLHDDSRQIYGSPRIQEDLVELKIHVGRKRIARLMRQAGIRGVCRRKKWRTTQRDSHPGAPNRVERDFAANGPDQLWVADITYIATWAGVLYLAVVIDMWSRKVVDWSMVTHMRTELVLNALNMAVTTRRPSCTIHHSDHGSQYTAIAFSQRCDVFGISQSMGSVGDCFDNALAESFFASLECELLDRWALRKIVSVRRVV